MRVKTDDQTLVGIHVFERAGLGKAPYKLIDVVRGNDGCHYCATGIRILCLLESADGKRFHVGSDCIFKAGGAGLTKLYKTHPAVRAMARQQREEKDKKVIAEWNQIMADEASCKILSDFKITKKDHLTGKEVNWLDFAKKSWEWCGMAGRSRYLKAAKSIINKTAIAI